jgi:hypothetical protein
VRPDAKSCLDLVLSLSLHCLQIDPQSASQLSPPQHHNPTSQCDQLQDPSPSQHVPFFRWPRWLGQEEEVQDIPCNRATRLPYLSLIKPEQAHALVLFQAALLERALLRCDSLNMLCAQSRHLSSEPTDLLLTSPLASDIA